MIASVDPRMEPEVNTAFNELNRPVRVSRANMVSIQQHKINYSYDLLNNLPLTDLK